MISHTDSLVSRTPAGQRSSVLNTWQIESNDDQSCIYTNVAISTSFLVTHDIFI